jgi:hypothetical protein
METTISLNKAFLISSFILAVFTSKTALGAQCAPADSVVAKTPTTTSIRCSLASAKCMAYDLDIESGIYKNYYGYHDNKCPGQAQRITNEYVCKRPDGTTYTAKEIATTTACGEDKK